MYSKIYTTNNLIHNVAYVCTLHGSPSVWGIAKPHYKQPLLSPVNICLTVDKRQLIPVELGLQAHTIGTG